MLIVWEVKMRGLLILLLAVACAQADKKQNDNRRNKLPFVADAVGNSLPPPSNVPATVGSPVNLITPDRYEFYTFDESGELVKRLMTLEEIQAIVAAGEEAEGLVTFANDNQPTVAFNIHQPPYNKVHSVVTNVQNVLKAQMEAHKNKPLIQPTLDTPDVSDSWSLILPSIFGNTGVDIVLDKSSGSVTPPDTETIEHNIEDNENALSKEENNEGQSSLATKPEEIEIVTEKISPTTKATTTTTSTTTTTTTTTTPKPTTKASTTTTRKPVTSTTRKPTTFTTRKPVISTTRKPVPTTKITTTSVPQNKVTKPRTTTIKPTTAKLVIATTTKVTTAKPEVSTNMHVTNVLASTEAQNIKVQIQPNSNAPSSTERNEAEFEKISTFIPVSTIKYVTERTTRKPSPTKATLNYASTTKRSVTTTTKVPITETIKSQTTTTTQKSVITSVLPSTVTEQDVERTNATIITTQSVSPSTTGSSTEFLSADKVDLPNNLENTPNADVTDDVDEINEPLPIFDVAQSISQIASDLGGNYQPLPTASNLLDTTKASELDLESKENLDIDIPSDIGNETANKTEENVDKNNDNFVKISTIDPHDKNDDPNLKDEVYVQNNNDEKSAEKPTPDNKKTNIIIDTVQRVEFTTTAAATTEPTTIDPILSESMGDLLSQVVNAAPSIVNSELKKENNEKQDSQTTTEKAFSLTSTENVKFIELTSEMSNKVKKDTSTTTANPVETVSEKGTNKIVDGSLVVKNGTNKNNTEIPEKKNGETITKASENKVKDKIDSIELNDKNFVQISGSTLKNDNVQETISDYQNKDKPSSPIAIPENSTDTTQKPEIITTPKIKENYKPSEQELKKTSGNQITTFRPDLDIPKTTSATINKNTQSKVNKINSKDKINTVNKKDKLPEPLPKVDDFKKKIQKVNLADEELHSQINNSWKLIPTLSPPKANEIPKDKVKSDNQFNSDDKDVVLDFSSENQGLEVTTKDLGEDIARFSDLSNELAFRYWNVIVNDIDKRRSFVFSPYSTFSMLAMIFMGARGATSGEMNEILKLDDMVTFNPHFTLKNISDSIDISPQSGVAVSAFIRELYSDRNKGKILTFYKERAQHFYNGHVEEINFNLISDIIRRRTNLLIKRYSWGKIPEYMKTNNIVMQPPLAAFTANIFQTDCSGTSVDGRDGEMYFVVSPNVRQRRLVPVPAVVYKRGFLAGYDPVLDVTVAALGNTNTVVSTLFLMPGQQGNVVHADDLEKLEQRLLEASPTKPTWNRVLRSLLPRTGLELQIPRFAHKSTFNTSQTLKKMGLKDLFDGEHADLGGLNGPSKDLYLSDMVQLNSFVTCGEGVVGDQHHIEEYPETLTVAQRRRARWLNDWDEPRDYQRAFHDPHDVSDAMHLPLHLRPRQARLPARSNQPARLKYDRPFLYFVRHNPSGMILYFGRYNPRLLP